MATRRRPSTSGRSSTELTGPRALLIPPGILLAGTLVAQAGFSERGQLAFALLAAAALLGLAALDPDAVRAALRSPVVLVFAALALLAAASAAWTIAAPADALRWGVVIGGYGVAAIAGFAIVRRGSAADAALLVVAVAVATGLIGVVAAALQAEPYAERIGGAWRPGGPFEYPPALAAVQLAALPAAMRSMVGTARPLAGAGVAALAAAVLALVSSRAMLAVGALLLLAAVLWPRRTLAADRTAAVAAAAFVITCGAAADAVAGSYADPYTATADLPRLVGLALVLGLAPVLWRAQSRCLRRSPGALIAASRCRSRSPVWRLR